jgi:hypothetical protein
MNPAREPTLRVTIVSSNPETLDGLQGYLRQAGVDARGTAEIESGVALDPYPCAVVFFPDEFPSGSVLREVGRLQRERPQLLILIVTRDPRAFSEVLDARDPSPTLVVAKPVWGWTILDAIRGHVETS